MKIKLGATIPTTQYGNLQPEFEADTDDYKLPASGGYIITPEMIMTDLESKIQALWDKYGEKPLTTKSGTTKRLKDFFGNEIDYDEVNHIYSWKGEIYESGSQYASKFDKPFDGQAIAGKMATKYGVKPEEILDMWAINGRASMEFGSAIHSALELYGKHRELAIKLERDSATHSHPIIKSAVQSFYEGRENDIAWYEVLVVDHKTKRAGRIDRLLEGAKYTVQDFKTNGELKPDKLKVYWKQLEFYSSIVEANGRICHPPQIFHYNGTWTTHENA